VCWKLNTIYTQHISKQLKHHLVPVY
jgi:hypothetical protein